jgi:hypothetical protein
MPVRASYTWHRRHQSCSRLDLIEESRSQTCDSLFVVRDLRQKLSHRFRMKADRLHWPSARLTVAKT